MCVSVCGGGIRKEEKDMRETERRRKIQTERSKELRK